MAIGTLRRSTGVIGILFVVLFVFGALLSMDSPDVSDDSPQAADQRMLHYLSSSGNRAQHIIGAYLLLLAAIAFLWMCNGLRERMLTARGADAAPARFVFGLAILGGAMMAGAAMTSAVVAGSVSAGGDPLPSSGDGARVVMNLTFPLLFVAFGVLNAALIAAISVATMRSGIFPRWVAYTGWIAALGSLGGIIFLPFALPLLWYLAVSVVSLRSTPAAPVAAPAVAAPTPA